MLVSTRQQHGAASPKTDIFLLTATSETSLQKLKLLNKDVICCLCWG